MVYKIGGFISAENIQFCAISSLNFEEATCPADGLFYVVTLQTSFTVRT